MILILELLNLTFYLPFFKADEADIGRNINELKKYHWFQNLLQEPESRELIIYDQKVRDRIGQLKTSKIEKMKYNEKCRRKVNRVLLNAA